MEQQFELQLEWSVCSVDGISSSSSSSASSVGDGLLEISSNVDLQGIAGVGDIGSGGGVEFELQLEWFVCSVGGIRSGGGVGGIRSGGGVGGIGLGGGVGGSFHRSRRFGWTLASLASWRQSLCFRGTQVTTESRTLVTAERSGSRMVMKIMSITIIHPQLRRVTQTGD